MGGEGNVIKAHVFRDERTAGTGHEEEGNEAKPSGVWGEGESEGWRLREENKEG